MYCCTGCTAEEVRKKGRKAVVRSRKTTGCLTSPKAPRPITLSISKSSLCSRSSFTVVVNGFTEDTQEAEEQMGMRADVDVLQLEEQMMAKPSPQTSRII